MQDPFKLFVIVHSHLKILGIEGIYLLFKRVFYRKRLIKIKVKGHSKPIFLRNNTSDITVFYQVFFKKSYAVNYKLFPKIIIDCGANIGLSPIFYHLRFPDAVIYAIEPEKSNFELLKRNTDFSTNIIAINSGIWNKQTNLLVENNTSEKWGFRVNEVAYSDSRTITGISIPSIMKKYGFSEIDILKIDIEGSEKELFDSNFKGWLPKTKILLIELHDGHRSGASKSFFKAISNYNFSMIRKGENLVFYIEQSKDD